MSITLLKLPFRFGANNAGETCGFTDPNVIAQLIGAGALVIRDGREKVEAPTKKPEPVLVELEGEEAPAAVAAAAKVPREWLAGAPKAPAKK
jgi:hypothetical protein